MNYRSLGITGIRVSEIGFGTWGIGGATRGAVAYGETDDRQSTEALLAAVENGITFFDTSDLYGYGHSEELLGIALREHRSKIVICTKAGFANGQNQNFESNYIHKCIKDSLDRLQTDYIDLFLLHSPGPEHLTGNTALFSLFEEMKKAEILRSWGVSARSPSEALIILEKFHPECLQVNFNLVDLRARDCGLWEACRRHGTGVIVRTPLAFGFLSGQVAPDQVFAANDHRQGFSQEQRRLWAESVPLYHSVFKKGKEATHAQNALRFCLSFPEVSTVIPGMLTRAEVLENAMASQLGSLEFDQIKEILDLSSKHKFFVK